MPISKRTVMLAAALAIACASLCNPAEARSVTIDEVVSVVNEYRAANEARIVRDFVDLLSLPNVADDIDDMERNATYIMGLLEQRGLTTRRLGAGGAPYIYAELTQPTAAETVLVYAHFDGQPVQEENWAYPPFSPVLLDAPLEAGGKVVDPATAGSFAPEWRLYGRSAGDDKMPIIALIHTLDALEANDIELSVNLKLLLDGEEEQGSPTIGRILDANRGLLKSDLLLFCDGPMHPSRRAQLVFGVRGDMTVDITTYGPTRPLHSGHYGNWAPNPVMQLSYLLTSMRDESGRILVDGYYDDVAAPTELERDAIATMPDTTAALQDELSINTPEGDGKRLEELIMLPALNVRGIVAGGVGEKGRNIILSTATTSLDLRLVPGQMPAHVRELIEAHMTKQGFHVVHDTPTAETLRDHPKVARLDWDPNSYPAYRTPLDNPVAMRMTKLMRLIRPDLIVTPTSGGSLPLYDFATRLDAAIISLPMANHDDNQHAENENIRLQNLWDAIAVYGAVLANYGDI